MSHINGDGYGSCHDWREVNQVGHCTWYKCAVCDAEFKHWYHSTPNIFEAIANAGVVDYCTPPHTPTPTNVKDGKSSAQQVSDLGENNATNN